MSDQHPLQQAYDSVFGGRRNLSTGERVGSVALGLAMAAGGLKRADGWGALLGLAGMALTARGVSGHCPVKSMAGESVTEGDQRIGQPPQRIGALAD